MAIYSPFTNNRRIIEYYVQRALPEMSRQTFITKCKKYWLKHLYTDWLFILEVRKKSSKLNPGILINNSEIRFYNTRNAKKGRIKFCHSIKIYNQIPQ